MTHIICKPYKIILFIFLLYVASACDNLTDWKVEEVKCEHLHNPIGINTVKPRFSWKNISSRQGAKQTAYQILVATEAEKLNENDADLWNSGKMSSANQLLVEYAGKSLNPGQILYWKVRTWNQEGRVSEWSETAHFSIGLLEKDDWKASYIAYPSEDGFYQCPQFRKSFSVKNSPDGSTYILHVNSLGYHEVYVNGVKIDDRVLAPAVTQFNKRSLINSYDVTSYIKEGGNELIVWLGSGWYTAGLPGVTGKGPKVRAQLERINPQSIETIVVTDDTWSARNSEYKGIGDWRASRFGGEIVTGNLEEQQKALVEPDKASWDKATIAEVPDHLVTPQMVEPNKIQETIHPVDIVKVNDTTYIVDMGKNLTGWFEIIFPTLQKSQRVEMIYADRIEENGEPAWQGQIDQYVASGSGQEYFINKFNYHGFRYVKIINIPTAPELSNIKAHLIHTDFEQIAQFECSDPEINQIHDLIQYTLRCLSLGGYLVDCPHLERLGYGGDGNASTMTAQTMFNLAPLYRNWLDAWEDVIREDGSMPHTAPNPYAAGGGPYWCGFIISAAWQSYQNYGDISFLEKYYPTMQKWLKYVDMYRKDGLLKRWPDTDYRVWYLGDWATPEGIDQTNEKSVDLVNNCYLSLCYNQMYQISTVLGLNQQAAEYLQKRENLNRKIHDTFYVNGIYGTGSQIDMVFPMLVNATPESEKELVVKNLHKMTDTNHNGHLATGLVGIPVIMEWASRNDQSEWVYSMLKKKGYPGYLHMLENGATTTWEHWNGERSRIHNCYNGVGQWFYQSIGGIIPVAGKPAYSEFLINPFTIKEITWANTQINTPKGILSVKWENLGNSKKIVLQVPVGSIAKVQKPGDATEVIINSERIDNAGSELPLQSGIHHIEFKSN